MNDRVRAGLPADLDDGLDAAGRIRREGDLGRVPDAFRPLVGRVDLALREAFGNRLHSSYLYGSVPRGTAIVGRSDLDVSVVLDDQPTTGDRRTAAEIAAELADRAVADEIGIVIDSRADILSDHQRYDEAFHISCLCTPLWGPDLAEELPDHYPTRDLAAGIGRAAPAAFERLGRLLHDQTQARPDLVRQRVGRRIARHAFASVLHRWPGWTSDPDVLVRVVTAFHPDRAEELALAVRLGWGRLQGRPPTGPDDHEQAVQLLAGAGWWLTEHRRATSGVRS
ncbi:MAG: hypothetical protein J2P23_04690 [Microlunatus sp.]|nr:hypothetical protein [Microlunatus sp.]